MVAFALQEDKLILIVWIITKVLTKFNNLMVIHLQVCERLASTQITAPPRPLVTHNSLHLLWPQPRRITELTGPSWSPPTHATLAVLSGAVPVHR